MAHRDPGLTLDAARGTGSTKKVVYVTARLGGWRSNRTVTITQQPLGGAESVVASGTVDASATHQPKTTTVYRARDAGDEWYSAAVAKRQVQ